MRIVLQKKCATHWFDKINIYHPMLFEQRLNIKKHLLCFNNQFGQSHSMT